MDPRLSSFIASHRRAACARRALFLVLLALFAASLLGLGCMARRPASLRPLSGILHLDRAPAPRPGAPSVAPVDAGATACTGTACSLQPPPDAGAQVFEVLEFREDQGSVIAIPW